MKANKPPKLLAALVGIAAFGTGFAIAVDSLPSWKDTDAKKNIVEFVENVTKEGSPDLPNSEIRHHLSLPSARGAAWRMSGRQYITLLVTNGLPIGVFLHEAKRRGIKKRTPSQGRSTFPIAHGEYR